MASCIDGLYVGVGVSTYVEHGPLPHACEDVAEVGKLLGFPEREPLIDPDEDVVNELRLLQGRLKDGGVLIFYWCGHGLMKGGLRLITHDDAKPGYEGLNFVEVIRPLVESGANQMLFIVDVCGSGGAIEAAGEMQRLLDAGPPVGRPWLGILTSCLAGEEARDGVFGAALRKVLASGPDDELLRESSWSPRSRLISLGTLGDTLGAEWSSLSQTVDFSTHGFNLPVLPNPLYAGEREWMPRIVEHLLQAARGGAGVEEMSAFTGRRTEVDRVVSWVRSAKPGLHVVTGPPGTGKSAVVGRVVSWSIPDERARLLAEGVERPDEDPGERSVTVNVHARAVTTDRLAALLDEQMRGAGFLSASETARTPKRLVAAVAAAGEVPVVVVDGLDESGPECFGIAREIVMPLARHACVVVATREARDAGGQSLLGLLDPDRKGLDLGTSEAVSSGLQAQREYVVKRLSGASPAMDPAKVAALVVKRNAREPNAPFVLARLVTDRLLQQPVDTSSKGWQKRVAASLGEAMSADLEDMDRPLVARQALTALTWAAGGGFPITEWATAAGAIGHESAVTELDLTAVLGALGQYILQDAEGGEAVYRLAHASLAEALRPTAASGGPFHRAILPVVHAFVARYRALLDAGIPPEQPTHLWQYIGWYAALAGPQGLKALRTLDIPALASYGEENAAWLYESAGRWEEAIEHLNKAIVGRRQVSPEAPGYLPALAYDLGYLGGLLGSCDRHQEALPLLLEEAKILKTVAAQDESYRPALADALNRLATCYAYLGQVKKARSAETRAVKEYDKVVKDQPAYLSWLASSLDDTGWYALGVRAYSKAVATLERAVKVYRSLAEDEPNYLLDLGAALSHLSSAYEGVGQQDKALTSAVSAWTTLTKARTFAEASDRDAQYDELVRTVETDLARLRSAKSAKDPAGMVPLE